MSMYLTAMNPLRESIQVYNRSRTDFLRSFIFLITSPSLEVLEPEHGIIMPGRDRTYKLLGLFLLKGRIR